MADTGGPGGSGGAPGGSGGSGAGAGCSAGSGGGGREGNQAQDGGQVHEIFGDTNLGLVMLVLLLLHLMQVR